MNANEILIKIQESVENQPLSAERNSNLEFLKIYQHHVNAEINQEIDFISNLRMIAERFDVLLT